MKILLVSLYFVEYAVELANALGEKNQVHLILSKHRVCQTIGEQLHERVTNKVSYTLLPKCSLRSPSFLRSVYAIIKIFMTFRYDVIHLQESGNPFDLFFFLFNFKPVVVTVHDVTLHPGRESNAVKPWKLWMRSRIFFDYFYDKIIVHGENLKKLLLRHHKKSAHNVFVVPHGCLFSYLSENNMQTTEEPHTVLFFGRIEEYKGLKYLIKAEPLVSKELPDFKVIVAGRGDDMDACKSILLNPHFELHDRFIPNKEVHLFFQRASVVILPYVEASQSGIVAMAFAFGKPVIVTDVGSLSEIVHDGKVGIVIPPRDTGRLSYAIIDLLGNKEKRLEMGKEALMLAKTILSWEYIANLTEEVYQKALKSD